VNVLDQCLSFDDFRRSGVEASTGDFYGFDLLKAVAMDFDF
jgi:hypothetical protein